MKRIRLFGRADHRNLERSARDSVPAADLCREDGVRYASIWEWTSKFGGSEVSQAKRLKGMPPIAAA